ncbi:hypothetical protein N9N71_03635, partial [Synechococcus sp. AH-229-G18]|nr:hypothetical protein [Synechococcus sp. AH-229-G18]
GGLFYEEELHRPSSSNASRTVNDSAYLIYDLQNIQKRRVFSASKTKHYFSKTNHQQYLNHVPG